MGFFKKVSVSAALISAVAVAAAMSASAMTASYSDGQVTLADLGVEAEQKTLLILSEDATDISGDKADTLANGGIIVQIDQDTDFTTVPVGTLADGTYYVRVGGDEGGYQQTTFKVGGDTVLVGDVTQEGKITAADATQVAMYTGGSTLSSIIEGEKSFYAAAYSNGDAIVSALDITAITRYVGGAASGALIGTEVEIGSIE